MTGDLDWVIFGGAKIFELTEICWAEAENRDVQGGEMEGGEEQDQTSIQIAIQGNTGILLLFKHFHFEIQQMGLVFSLSFTYSVIKFAVWCCTIITIRAFLVFS